MKKCNKCLQYKKLNNFYKGKFYKDGFITICKLCIKKKDINKYKDCQWIRHFRNLKARCNNPKNNRYYCYGRRGIKCMITEKELKFIWFRDNAYNLKKPSIDRINNDGNYELNNCRFIELNRHLSKHKSKVVLQSDLNNKFIKEFKSVHNASQKLNIHENAISNCARNETKTSGKFKWRYK